MRRFPLGATAIPGAVLFAGVSTGSAKAENRPTVVELFTSEGCSSCPPADALLREFSRTRADLLPLAFHVTYWNYLGWRDPFSFDGATARQRFYASSLSTQVYTPQMVVDGRADVVGSDRRATEAALQQAARDQVDDVTVSVRRDGVEVIVEVAGGRGSGRVLLVGYDPEHTTPVGRGENGGRTLVEANIVRSFDAIGAWDGTALRLRHAMPAGERIAVIVQSADGHIIGAAREVPDAG
jgi:hypothetical protein